MKTLLVIIVGILSTFNSWGQAYQEYQAIAVNEVKSTSPAILDSNNITTYARLSVHGDINAEPVSSDVLGFIIPMNNYWFWGLELHSLTQNGSYTKPTSEPVIVDSEYAIEGGAFLLSSYQKYDQWIVTQWLGYQNFEFLEAYDFGVGLQRVAEGEWFDFSIDILTGINKKVQSQQVIQEIYTPCQFICMFDYEGHTTIHHYEFVNNFYLKTSQQFNTYFGRSQRDIQLGLGLSETLYLPLKLLNSDWSDELDRNNSLGFGAFLQFAYNL